MGIHDWIDIVDVHHDGKHQQKLGIRKDTNYRETWCSYCAKAVVWERVVKIEQNKLGFENENRI